MNLVEMFSGIGSQAKAISKLGVEYNLLNTCEWNVHALVAYDIIHNGNKINELVLKMTRDELEGALKKMNLSFDGKKKSNPAIWERHSLYSLQRVYSSIINTNNLVNIQDVTHDRINEDIDVLTYSFPCQDLSNVGSFHGYNKGIDRDSGSRSGLIWEIERLLNELNDNNRNLPKYLVLENVTTLLSERHKKNFEEWQAILREMGYYNKVYTLNATDFGVPQNRKRLVMISTYCNHNDEELRGVERYFDRNNLEDPNYIRRLDIYKKVKLSDLLKLDYTNKCYLQEALLSQPNDTISRRKIWEDNYKIVNETGNIAVDKVATLTTKQDRHPNSGNIYFNVLNGKSKFRFLTPRECFMLMGFTECDFQNIIDSNFNVSKHRQFFTRDNLLKMAGNSIVVNVLEYVFYQIVELDREVFNNRINA